MPSKESADEVLSTTLTCLSAQPPAGVGAIEARQSPRCPPVFRLTMMTLDGAAHGLTPMLSTGELTNTSGSKPYPRRGGRGASFAVIPVRVTTTV
jgi:hypothetical protein